jgi:hypothetical protein
MTDDRAKIQSIDPHFSDSGLGDDLRSFLGNPAPAQPRTRNLRPTFRAVPSEQSGDPGFPGTRAFSQPAYRSDPGAAGSVGQSAGAGVDGTPAPAAGANGIAGRRPSFPKAIQRAIANGPVLPANPSPAGGRVRGRPGRPPGSGKKAKLAQANSPGSAAAVSGSRLTAPLPVGARVFITDPDHPWNGHAGEVTSGMESYGLGWQGQRMKLDGNNGECYVSPAQTGRVGAALAKPSVTTHTPQPVSPKYTPTESERADARRLFRAIGKTFNENRKKSRPAAYAQYRHDLMENMDTLIMGGAIDLKEITTVITNLEQLTRETEAESTETPATILGRWLRMDASEFAGLTVVENAVENVDEESGEEINELEPFSDPVHAGNGH